MWALWKGIKYTIRGKVVASPKFRSWWILWVQVCSWLVLTPKVFQLCINRLIVWFVQVCVSDWVLVLLLSPISEFEHAPLPLKCYKPGNMPQLLFLLLFSPWTRSWVQKGAWGCIRVTICFDGWDNIVKCPLLNMTFTCTSGNVFLCAINIVKEHKDAHYKCNTLVGYIETIRVDIIVQIYTKCFKHTKCSWPFDWLFFKPLLSRRCNLLFGRCWKIGEKNLHEAICDKAVGSAVLVCVFVCL
jgi:hypothetical protein